MSHLWAPYTRCTNLFHSSNRLLRNPVAQHPYSTWHRDIMTVPRNRGEENRLLLPCSRCWGKRQVSNEVPNWQRPGLREGTHHSLCPGEVYRSINRVERCSSHRSTFFAPGESCFAHANDTALGLLASKAFLNR